MDKIIWTFDNLELEKKIIGPLNNTLDIINSEFKTNIRHINNKLICDEDCDKVVALMKCLTRLNQDKHDFSIRDIVHIMMILNNSHNYDADIEKIINFYNHKLLILNTSDGNRVYAKTLLQKRYIELLDNSNIMFVTGSAGTGKTYLAVAYAVNMLKKNIIKRIIITRPAVEAGEKLGFLPGDLKEKVDPYLTPIYDALNDFLGKENVEKLTEKGTIEVAPLAYMRGRTLDHAVIILDEAQNTTSNQMKMFITRLGFDSKMIITGDLSQIDLSSRIESGLLEAVRILQNIDGISFLHFTKYDVMRHPLVSKVIARYEENNND